MHSADPKLNAARHSPGEPRPAAAAHLLTRRRSPYAIHFIAFALLALALSAPDASAQSAAEDLAAPPPPAWGDGTWLGDEGVWDSESAPPPADDTSAAQPGSPAIDETPPASGDPSGDPDADLAAAQRAGPTIDDFHSALDSNGQWIDTPEYGLVWQPNQVDSSWLPYSNGQWVYSQAGWYWSGYEPWAWAVYHYGRWARAHGTWFWLPGRVWGPAWVAWRWGQGYAGWAPLGPRGSVWGSPSCWAVVEQRRFLAPVPSSLASNQVRRSFVRDTRVLPVLRPGPRAGPSRERVATALGGEVPVARFHPVRSAALASSGASGSSINVFRPTTRPIVSAQARRNAAVAAPRESGDTGEVWGAAPYAPAARFGEAQGERSEPTRAKVIEFAPAPERAPRQGGVVAREAHEAAVEDAAGAESPPEESAGSEGSHAGSEGARGEGGHDAQHAEGGRGAAGGAHAVHSNPKPVQKGAFKPK